MSKFFLKRKFFVGFFIEGSISRQLIGSSGGGLKPAFPLDITPSLKREGTVRRQGETMDLIQFFRKTTHQAPLSLSHKLRRDLGAQARHVTRSWTAPSLKTCGPRKVALLALLVMGSVTFSSCLPKNDLTATSQPRPIEEQLSAPVGSSAQALLNGARYTELSIEIQSLGEAEISQEALNHLRDFILDTTLISDQNIEINLNPSVRELQPLSLGAELDLIEVRNLEKRFRRGRPILNRGSIFILVADLPFTDDTATRKTYALAHQNTSIVVHHSTIRAASSNRSPPERWQLEAAVIEHEIGHLMGLTQAQTSTSPPTPNMQDEPGSKATTKNHCSTRGCLMHENTQDAARRAIMTETDGIPRLCPACRQALESLREQSR
jgi:hypothetical protein